jgi:hypothetical protein
MRMASRQCECACEPSDRQLWHTCTHTYHTQTVAHQCVSLHDDHSLIFDCSHISMPGSSTCARPPRVQCEEGREQTRAQQHLRGSTSKHIPSARVSFLHIQTYASVRYSSHALSCIAAARRASTRTKTSQRLPANYGFVSRIRVRSWSIYYT